MNINFEYYKVFYWVCVCKSITGAAGELCISQPAVSQAIRQLERETGARLFVRSSRGVALTREGELLFGHIKKGVESLMEGGRMLERLLNMEEGEVRIGASDMTLQFFLLPYLEQFHRDYPHIKVKVTNAPTPETIQGLEEGRIDFGLVTTPFEVKNGMKKTEVSSIRTLFIAGDSFEALRGKELDYRELEQFPCIFLEKNTSTRAFMDGFLESQGVFLTPEFELAISDMIVQFARRNMGVGCVMEGFAREMIEKGEIFPLRFKTEMPERHICVLTMDSSLISVPGRKLLHMLGIHIS